MKNIWLVLFLVWGLPLAFYRSKFRKMVYQTDKWIINIKPVFLKEIKALFGNTSNGNKPYIKFRNFYRFYLALYLVLFICYFSFKGSSQTINTQNMNKIEVGSSLPEFTLPDQNGILFDISTVVGKKKLVIYFYPKDDTPGCTKEACSFRDQFEVFRDAGALVIGISGQSVESHKKFADKYHLTYTLLADVDNKIRKLFEVPTNFLGLIPGRVTYIIDLDGKVVNIFNSQSQVNKHVDEALTFLKGMK
jgi:thioredoxin-dependent peroxiredoxin